MLTSMVAPKVVNCMSDGLTDEEKWILKPLVAGLGCFITFTPNSSKIHVCILVSSNKHCPSSSDLHL